MKFEEKSEQNKYGTTIDVSELTLENQETHEPLGLVKEKIMISPESVANFVYTWGEVREFAVKKDQEFSLKPEEQIKYKLIDVQPGKAVIVDTQKPDVPIEVVTPGCTTNRKDCNQFVEQQEKDFNDMQKSQKKNFDSQSHTKQEKKAFEDMQKTAKDNFQMQYKADEEQCKQLPK